MSSNRICSTVRSSFGLLPTPARPANGRVPRWRRPTVQVCWARDVDRRRAHAFPARAGLRGPGPPAEPDAALLASRARRAGLDLAESPARGRGRVRRAAVRSHPRRDPVRRRDRRPRHHRRRRPLVHPVVSARRRARACRRHRRPRAGLTGAVRRAAIPIVLLLGWVLAVRAAADLRLDAESQVGNAVDLRLRATNGADAPVHDVVPELVYRHRTVLAERVQTSRALAVCASAGDGPHHAVRGVALLSVAPRRAEARPLLVGAPALAVALATLALAWRSVRARQPRV